MSTLAPYIVFCGNVATGKSTAARLYAERTQCDFVPEPVDQLSYVTDFFADMKTWAFAHQMDFLLLKAHQERDIARGARSVCLDRSLDECFFVFSKRCADAGWMSPAQWSLLTRLHGVLADGLRRPDLIVFLTARLDVRMDRIRRRDRGHERNVDPGWLRALDDDYAGWRSTLRSPTLDIDTSEIDCLTRAADCDRLVAAISGALPQQARGISR